MIKSPEISVRIFQIRPIRFVRSIRSPTTPAPAVRAIAFDTTAESWLKQQMQYELWHAEQLRKRMHVKRIRAA